MSASKKKAADEDHDETADERIARYEKSYDVSTLARMCVETEEAHEREEKRFQRLIFRLKEKNRRLVGALDEARVGFQGQRLKAEENAGYIDDALKRNRGV